MYTDGIPLYLSDKNPIECLVAKGYQEGSGMHASSLCQYNFKFFIDLSIVYQSPEQIVCNSGREEVALYCVVNILSQETIYNWHTPTTFKLPSTPVIYVTKPGIYFCTVKYKDEEVVSQPCEISVIPSSGR